MDRLRDRPASSDARQDPIEAEAAELMRAIAPYAPPPNRKERVRRAIEQHARDGGRRAGRMRPVLVAGTALVITAIAGVSLGRTWVRDFCQRIMQPTETLEKPAQQRGSVSNANRGERRSLPAEAPSAPSAQATAPAAKVPAPASAPQAAQLSNPVVLRPAPTSSKVPSATESPRGLQPARAGGASSVDLGVGPGMGAGRHAAGGRPRHTVQAPAIHRASSSEDAGLVVAAMQALRSNADPVKAGTLLDEYLRLHPRGILAEEALVLAIESAQARSDGRTATLAQQYLRTYPNGAYADTARRALEHRQ